MIRNLNKYKLLLHYGIIIVYNCNNFDYDPVKSAANKIKHGIDFEAAKSLWLDQKLLELNLTSQNENRFMLVGKLHKQYWSAIITYRQNRVRIISVRRARKKERKLYEKNNS